MCALCTKDRDEISWRFGPWPENQGCRMGSRGFKARPNTYLIDLSPSARAHCRGCKGAVAKGDLRVVIRAFVCPGRWTQFVRHTNCVSASLARSMVAVHGSVYSIPVGAGVDADTAEATRAQLRQSASAVV